MDKIVYALPALGCVVGMPLMMFIMMRGGRSKPATPGASEAAQLRAEVEQLRGELSQRSDANP